LSDPSAMVVSTAIEALEPARAGSVTGRLIAIARRPEREWRWARRGAAVTLARAGDSQARDVLLDILASDGMAMGQDFVSRVASSLDHSVAPRLADQFRSGIPGRDGVAFVLGELRARDAVSDLCAVIRDERTGSHLTVTCIVALGKISDPAAVPALVRAARHRDALVRTAALEALTTFGSPQVAEAALAATDDFAPDVRDRAVRLLAARGDRRATSRLLMLCDGPLAPAVLRGLARIADERALPLLRQLFLATTDRRVRVLTGRAIVRSAQGQPQLPLGDWMPLPQLRAAIWVHGEIGSASSVRQLSRLLTHRDELVRARTATALGKVGDPAAAAGLKNALNDISPRVRASAATALGAVGGKQALGWLELLRDDPRPDVRMAATASLRRLTHGS
jgi:HEAT repeat protein